MNAELVRLGGDEMPAPATLPLEPRGDGGDLPGHAVAAVVSAVLGMGGEAVRCPVVLAGAFHAAGAVVAQAGPGAAPDAVVLVGAVGAADVSEAALLARRAVVAMSPAVSGDETLEALGLRLGLHVLGTATVSRIDVAGRPWWLVRGRCS
jgi:hypothetical protein